MIPMAIVPDAKGTVDTRGRGTGGSATADAGRGFDGVLADLGDAAAVAAGEADSKAGAGLTMAGDTSQAWIPTGSVGATSRIAALVGRAAAPSEADGAKPEGRDDSAGASSLAPAQMAVPFGLLNALAGMAVPTTGSAPVTAGRRETTGIVPGRAVPTARSTDGKDADPTTTSAIEAAAAMVQPVLAPSKAPPTPVAGRSNEKSAEIEGDPIAPRKATTVTPISPAATAPGMTTAMPMSESVAIAAGSRDTRVATPKARTERPSDAADPAVAHEGAQEEAPEATIRAFSISTQIAPTTSARAGRLAGVTPTSASLTDGLDATAERARVPAGKTEAPAPDVVVPSPTTTATTATIADAVSDLADTPSTTSAPSPAPTPTLAPARTMVLRLAPANLGTVAVRLHLTGQTLDVQLSVSDPKTLGLVSRERDALAARLDDCGYQLNTLVIRGADSLASSTAGSHDPSHNGADADRDQGADPGRRGTPGQCGRDSGQRAASNRASPGGDTSVDGRGGLFI